MSDTFTLGTPSIADDLRLTPQARKVLAHLKDGKRLTPVLALTVYGVGRLASRINEIRQAGYNVLTENKRDEQGHRYGSYRLV